MSAAEAATTASLCPFSSGPCDGEQHAVPDYCDAVIAARNSDTEPWVVHDTDDGLVPAKCAALYFRDEDGATFVFIPYGLTFRFEERQFLWSLRSREILPAPRVGVVKHGNGVAPPGAHQ